MTMSESERTEFLKNLGLNPTAPALVADVQPATPVKEAKKKKQTPVQIAPEGVDPHTMPVSDIVFDPSLLDEFPDLSGANYRLASDKVFAMYRSKGRDKDRNGLLHRRITEFIGSVKRSRKTGGFVKEKIKSTAEEREIANLLATHGVTVADLAELLDKEK